MRSSVPEGSAAGLQAIESNAMINSSFANKELRSLPGLAAGSGAMRLHAASRFPTQPVPNPIAFYMHRSPGWFHQFETLVNHFIELVVPFFIFLGRRMCLAHGVLQILFQRKP
ncbi:UNVERIFIED_CONTAM: hypothetical protein K2H54_003580 [Gekko kuhli]